MDNRSSVRFGTRPEARAPCEDLLAPLEAERRVVARIRHAHVARRFTEALLNPRHHDGVSPTQEQLRLHVVLPYYLEVLLTQLAR